MKMEGYSLMAKKHALIAIVLSFLIVVNTNNLYAVKAVPENKPENKTDQVPKQENQAELEESPETAIYRIYEERNKAFISRDLTPIKENYDTSQKFGQWALEHEIKRVKYLNKWAEERKMKFTNVVSVLRIKKVTTRNGKSNMSLEESYKFDYIYKEDSEPVENSFGVGIRHGVSLVKKNNTWIIYNDWYTDCFEDALQGVSADVSLGTLNYSDIDNSSTNIKSGALSVYINNTYYGTRYNREKAIEYADKYCGAAWGSKNNFKYNKKYADFNGIGGDCTNFASQVLGDKEEGGGLSHGGGWHCVYYKYGGSQGSRAWVNADGLKDYLLYSGRGRLIKKGTFKELTAPVGENMQCAVDRLELADLVCYEKKGNIDHFAVVTARDSHGYPLVNSHTTDRYHVPWDLGWGDKHIKFLLIHIN